MWRRSFQTADENTDRPSRPWMAVSEDGGATFDTPFMMLDKDIGFDAPRPIVVDDRIFAFYRVRPEAEDADNLVVAGVSDDGGRTWEETEIAAAGFFHLVWHDNSNDKLDAFYAKSTDGRSWSEPVRVNDDPAGNRIGQFYPVISLAEEGRVDVAWYDYRDDPYPAPVAEEGETLNLFNNMGNHQSVYSSGAWRFPVALPPSRSARALRVADLHLVHAIALAAPAARITFAISLLDQGLKRTGCASVCIPHGA